MESKDYIKIGISSDTTKRVKSLNKHLSVEDRFSIIKIHYCEDRFLCMELEKYLHDKYKHYQIITNIRGAKTECFSKQILNDVLNDFIEIGEVYVYDPFIFVGVNEVHKVLGKPLEEIFKILGVSKGVQNSAKKALKNLAANIIKSKNRRIFYNTRILRFFGTATTMTNRVFHEMWPKFTSMSPVVDVKLISLQRGMIKPFGNYKRMSGAYLVSIESIHLYQKGVSIRQDKFLDLIYKHIDERL